MNRLTTLPTTGEQARHALLLLGAPAPARLVVDVHAAFFDGDLSMAALAAVAHGRVPGLCVALRADLSALAGTVALAEWSLERRILTPAYSRAGELTMILRVAEFAGMRPGSGRAEELLLRALAVRVPHGPEASDLVEAVRVALADEGLNARLAAEERERTAAVQRAAELDLRQQRFGVAAVPHQRGGE